MPKLKSGIAQDLRIFITGRIKFKPMGEVKRRIVSDFIIKEKINIKNIFACGNSQWDLDFLRFWNRNLDFKVCDRKP